MSNDRERPTTGIEPAFKSFSESIKASIDRSKVFREPRANLTGLDIFDKSFISDRIGLLTTIAARPGQGKTSLACQIAVKMAEKGKKVLFLSLEMDGPSVTDRMFFQDQFVNGFSFYRGEDDEQETQKKWSKFYAKYANIPLSIIDNYAFTIEQLENLFTVYESDPDIFILDHLQHIKSDVRLKQYEVLSNYLATLKSCSLKHKFSIFLLSQINRAGEEAPTLSNLKGTGAIEEMSDQVLLMDYKDTIKTSDNMTINVAKNRFGPTGQKSLFYKAEYFKFYNSFSESL